MARVKRGFKARRRRKRVIRQAEGFFGRRKNCFTVAAQAVDKAGQYAYIGRKRKKRDFRRLWVVRINAAARACGTSYSRLICALKEQNIDLNRKMLAEIATNDPKGFEALVSNVIKSAA